MKLKQQLPKNKSYYRLSMNLKMQISRTAIEALRNHTDDLTDDQISELAALGAIIKHKSAEFPDMPTVVSLTPFGEAIRTATLRITDKTLNSMT